MLRTLLGSPAMRKSAVLVRERMAGQGQGQGPGPGEGLGQD